MSCAAVPPGGERSESRAKVASARAKPDGMLVVPVGRVAEFAPADLAAALGISHDQAKELIGDALELAYRLPRLWDLAQTGRVPVWRARAISRETSSSQESLSRGAEGSTPAIVPDPGPKALIAAGSSRASSAGNMGALPSGRSAVLG